MIPDGGRFHRGQCRFVRGIAGTSTLSRDRAAQQGYAACGVCKP